MSRTANLRLGLDPFLWIRRETKGWRWVCEVCPAGRGGLPRNGLHRHVRFTRPRESGSFDRCRLAALRHLKLYHT